MKTQKERFWLYIAICRLSQLADLIKLKNIFLYLETGHVVIDETVMQLSTYQGAMKPFIFKQFCVAHFKKTGFLWSVSFLLISDYRVYDKLLFEEDMFSICEIWRENSYLHTQLANFLLIFRSDSADLIWKTSVKKHLIVWYLTYTL